EPLALRPDHAGAELARDVARPVGRAVVDDDALEVGVVELGHALEALAQRRGAVVRADDDRHGRPAELAGDRNVGEGVADGRERRLRRPLAVDEPEVPVVDVAAAAVPLVGPGEDEGARAAGGERRAHLPAEPVRLAPAPVRRAAGPSSVMTSGRPPARFWSRARYAVSSSSASR